MRRFLTAACVCFMALTACGTYVPDIQEIGDDSQGEMLVKAIVGSINCEIRRAINVVINNDSSETGRNRGHRYTTFLDKWGVQVGLTFVIEEKTTVNPLALWTPSGQFTLGASLNGSADATRKSILNYFFTVEQIRNAGPCKTNYVQAHPPGSLLIDNNLKLAEWLSAVVTLYSTRQIGEPTNPNTIFKQNALSHEVKFEVITSGSVTPGIKITHFALNQSGSLLSTSRDRTHDLLITLGPVDEKATDSLAPLALGTFLNLQLGSTLTNFVASNILP